MKKVGDRFTQNGVEYVVIGMDGAGRAISSCRPEDLKKKKGKEKADEPKQEELKLDEEQSVEAQEQNTEA